MFDCHFFKPNILQDRQPDSQNDRRTDKVVYEEVSSISFHLGKSFARQTDRHTNKAFNKEIVILNVVELVSVIELLHIYGFS